MFACISAYSELVSHAIKFGLYYSSYPHIRNSIFHSKPKNVSYNKRLSGNEGQYFLYEGRKLIAYVFTMFE